MKYYVIETNLKTRQARIISVCYSITGAREIAEQTLARNKNNDITYLFLDENNMVNWLKLSLFHHPYDITFKM